MLHDPKLAKYDVKLPSKRLLTLLRTIGWTWILGGLGLLAIDAYKNTSTAGDNYRWAQRDFSSCLDELRSHSAYEATGLEPKGLYMY